MWVWDRLSMSCPSNAQEGAQRWVLRMLSSSLTSSVGKSEHRATALTVTLLVVLGGPGPGQLLWAWCLAPVRR